MEEFNFNYFRGQRSNWKVLPGLLRDSTNKEYINHFEQEYKRLAYNYPEELSYLPYDKNNRLERANYLSILQHYGMQTSLLDITKIHLSHYYLWLAKKIKIKLINLVLFCMK